MPITIAATASEANSYGNPFVGPAEHRDVVKVDISDLGSNEVDADGYIKPGLPLAKDGNMVTAGVPVYGSVMEATKIATGNTDTILDATTDCFVAVCTHGVQNRDITEDNLGRALNADEIAGFDLAPCTIKLTRT